MYVIFITAFRTMVPCSLAKLLTLYLLCKPFVSFVLSDKKNMHAAHTVFYAEAAVSDCYLLGWFCLQYDISDACRDYRELALSMHAVIIFNAFCRKQFYGKGINRECVFIGYCPQCCFSCCIKASFLSREMPECNAVNAFPQCV